MNLYICSPPNHYWQALLGYWHSTGGPLLAGLLWSFVILNCICMYVCMYVCMRVCGWKEGSVCRQRYAHICMYICIHHHIYFSAPIYTYMYVHTHTIHMYTHRYMVDRYVYCIIHITIL